MPNIIKTKAFSFALNIIHLAKNLQEQKEFILSKQLLRSGTAIGAMIQESKHAESRADFIHKMAIAQKEASECKYWLELLHQSHQIHSKTYNNLTNELISIQKILASIILTTKSKTKR